MARWRLRLFWAALLAVITGVGMYAYLRSLQEMESVVVASQNITARTEITADMVKVVHVNRANRRQLAPNSFSSVSDVVGRHARRSVEAGDILRSQTLTDKGEARQGAEPGEGAMADFLPPETRAITLRMDQEAVLGQHVRPGDLVDLIFTSKSSSTGGVYASLLIQQVHVLDIQQPEGSDPDRDVLVTVLVTPQQAVDVALAKRTGEVDLALNPPDPGKPVSPTVTSPLEFIGVPLEEQG